MGRRKITASPSRVVKRERKPSAAVAPKRRGFSSVQQMMISSTAAADLDADSSASSYPSESVLEIKSVLPKREPLVTKIAQPSIMQSATLIPPQNILEEQTRELSYGRSATLPSTPEMSEGSVPAVFRPLDEFPIFKDGDVIIETKLGNIPQIFQLHSSILARHSMWFASVFQQDTIDIQPSWYLFKIEEIDSQVKLVRQLAQGERPNLSHTMPATPDTTYIKFETGSGSNLQSTTAQKRKFNQAATITAYTQLFAAFYNHSPPISTSSIQLALSHSETLLRLARNLGCIHLLQPHLSKTFTNYRQTFWEAIAADPPRWMRLSLYLEDRAIYTECLIHLVGAHPAWPWKTGRRAVPENVREIVRKKSAQMKLLVRDVQLELLLVTMSVQVEKGKTRPLNPGLRCDLESWMVVSVLREETAQWISSMEKGQDASLQVGGFFRGIYKGTAKWFQNEYVKEACEKILSTKWEDLAEDLEMLRKIAKEVVQEVARNELMIDPETCGLGYLTCVKTVDEDIPWLAARVG